MTRYGTFAGDADADAALAVCGSSPSSASAAASGGVVGASSDPLLRDDPAPSRSSCSCPPGETTASLASRILFLFVQPVVALSRTRMLRLDDLWSLTPENKNVNASQRFRAEYAATGSLVATIRRTELPTICISALFAALAVVCVSAVPLLLFRLLTLVMKTEDASESMSEILLLLAATHCGVVLGEIFSRHCYFRMFKAQLRIVTSIRSLVFEKSIEKSHRNGRRKGRGIAAIATIYSSNLIFVSWWITRLHIAWMAAAKLFVLLLILHTTLHVSGVVIVCSLTAICFVMLVMTVGSAKVGEKCTKKRAKTLNAINECFKGIQAIKLHAWEKKIDEKIMRARHKEEKKQFSAVMWRTVRYCFIWESPALASVVIFYSLATQNSYFSPATVFTALVLFDRIQIEIYALIYAIRVYVEGAAALRRIQKYIFHCDTFVKTEVSHTDEAHRYPPNVLVAVDHAFFAEGMTRMKKQTDFVLTNVNVTVQRGELVVVHGKAGAGKSTLLSSLMGEVVRVKGEVYVSGACKIAYCSEEPWLQTLSVRENILFGATYVEAKYIRVLDACCLIEDLNTLPDGEDTMVGPKGINLSGGQKARIALARALYSEADLFILDCPLASADAIVQSDVFRKCFLELLRYKTIILATHNPEIISSEFVDRLWELGDMMVQEIDRNASSHSERKFDSSRRVRRLTDIPPWKKVTPLTGSRQQESSPLDSFSTAVHGYSPPDNRASQRTIRRSQVHQHPVNHDAQRSPFSLAISKEVLWSQRGWKSSMISASLLLVYGGFGVAKNFWLMHWSNLAPMRDTMLDAATVYGSLICIAFCVILAATLVLCYAIFLRSQVFFKKMTSSLLYAPMSFFYRTPIGEILVRYASDMQASDLATSYHVAYLFRSLLSLVTGVGTVCYLLGGAGALIAATTVYVCRDIVEDRLFAQVFTVRDKIDAINLNFVSEALDGSAVIRAFGVHHLQRFRLQHGQMLDKRSRIAYAVEAFNDWSLIRYSLLVGIFFALVAMILAVGSLTSSALGLVLHCIFNIQHDLIAFSTGLTNTTVHLTSIKNVLDLQQIEPEEDETSKVSVHPSVEWPTKGEIVFDRVWFQYLSGTRTPTHDVPFALRDVSLSIQGGEKVGIVGRTGSGKSSLAMALFRVHDPAHGRILIDGVDICRLRLSDLRSRLCIIPQSPLFYRCSVRSYMDPFNEFDDAQLWQALKKTGLSGNGSNATDESQQHLCVKSLEKQLHENGENWSLGERQMLALARALLKPSRVLILDESFSSVDQGSDKFLLNVVGKEFVLSTVFLITHRLDQVLGFDRIIVMQDGAVVECGSAEDLVTDPDSTFYEFLETTLLTF
uniref:ABC transporter domain-containing protein n=1 Tax=Globisporangium ultimum (strain ATCC 200006 / CBS 805.95 / DAOM BR144) TaxID=431595 RepID=K3X306_GLOUD